MKFLITTLTLFVTVFCFGGNGLVVTQKYFDNNVQQHVTVTWYVSGTLCKMKMNYADEKVSTSNWFVPDYAGHNLLIYTEGNVPTGAKKAYYTVPVTDIQPDKSKDYSRVKTQKTGEQKVISGMKCEKIVATTNKSVTEIWVTQEFTPDYFLSFPYFRNSAELNALYDGGIKGFPLESVTKDLSGQILYSYTLISAENTNLSETDFKVPSEYEDARNTTKK